jgi:uridylate kinase
MNEGPVAPRMVERRAHRTAPVVLSVGGSVLRQDRNDARYFSDLADLLRRVAKKVPLLVTTGGGAPAREYIGLGRSLGLTEVELDELGIEVTRLHARLLAGRVGPPTPAAPPTTLAAAAHEAHRAPLVILGGTEAGHTTDGVAALLAARLRAARVVNATSVDGLYDADPTRVPTAKRIPHIDWTRFRAIVRAGTDGSAGQNFVFDRLGADTLAAARIPLRIVAGRDLPNLADALEGRRFRGTLVD